MMLTIWYFIQDMLVPGAAGAIAALGILKFLSAKYIEQQLSKDMERHKAELAQRTESLKTQLSIYAHEQNVATSRIDIQRAKSVEIVFSAIRAWVNPTLRIAAGCPTVNATTEMEFEFYQKHAEEAHAAAKKLMTALADHAIYFEEQTYDDLYSMSLSFMDVTAAFLRPIRKDIAEGRPLSDSLEDIKSERLKLSKLWDNELLPFYATIISKFRSMLGMSN